MGCDIHAYIEARRDGVWICLGETFDFRNYGVFGFLAGVRNHSAVPPLSSPRGLPPDLSEFVARASETWADDAHSRSWLSALELLEFDYDATFENRRVTRQMAPNIYAGGCTCEPGQGTMTTYREFLGESFMANVAALALNGPPDDVRVVFWFDN